MNNEALISVCIPVYNGQKYLSAVLDSIQGQSFQDFEVVISDDASSDRTLQIAREHSICATHTVRIVRNEQRGIGRNWNHAIRNARGKFIKLIFQDDLLHEHCLEHMLEHCVSGVSMVWCRKTLIGDVPAGRQAEEDAVYRNTAAKTTAEIFGDPHLYKHPRNPFGEPICSFFQKSMWESCQYDETLKQGLDYEHAYRMLKMGSFVFLNSALVSFRLHNEQTTARNKRKVIKDQYLLPAKLLRAHFKELHLLVLLLLCQKMMTGWILFKLNKLLS